MVTDVDREAEALIVDGLREARPDDTVIGEEGSRRTGASHVTWVIDPLDGTTNYLYGFPSFAVSIAAEVDGRAAIGVVHDAVHRETFTASAGGGAQRDGAGIAPSGCKELPTALVATGFSYEPAERDRQARVLTAVLPRVRDIRRAGAAALDLCWVACGRLDVFYERGLQRWDMAAGALIVAEAGGTVTTGDRWVLATTPALHEPMRHLLAEAGEG